MGRRKAATIAEAWAERRALRDLMQFLQSQGLPVALAVRILRKYGSASESVVRQQPYRLASEVYGISFQVADALAARAGIEREAPQRIGAGLGHVLRAAEADGHAFFPQPLLVDGAVRVLSLPPQLISGALPE